MQKILKLIFGFLITIWGFLLILKILTCERETYFLIISITTIFILSISFLIWKKFKIQKSFSKKETFYPPRNYNSAELGFLYRGEKNQLDIASLIIYFAEKGYLKIIQEEGNSLFKKENNYKIIKTRDCDESNSASLFFKNLFSVKNELSIHELEPYFENYSMKQIKNNVDELIDKRQKNIKNILYLFEVIILFLFLIEPIYFSGYIALFLVVFIPIITIILILHVLFSRKIINKNKILFIFLILLLSSMPMYIFYYPFLIFFKFYLGHFLLIFSLLIIEYFNSNIEIWTKKGANILNELIEFKLSTESIKESKFKELLDRNSNYLWEIFPVLFAIDNILAEEILKKFEKFDIEPPKWYFCNQKFNLANFLQFVEKFSVVVDIKFIQTDKTFRITRTNL